MTRKNHPLYTARAARPRSTILIVLFFLLTSSSSFAEPKKADWLAFSIGPVAAIQQERKSFFSFISYAPRYFFSENVYTRANLGFTMFRNATEELFPVIEAQTLAGYFFAQNFGAEMGAGIQNFVGNGGVAFAMTGNLVYRLDTRLLLIDRFLIGYSPVFFPHAQIHEVRVAAGVSF